MAQGLSFLTIRQWAGPKETGPWGPAQPVSWVTGHLARSAAPGSSTSASGTGGRSHITCSVWASEVTQHHFCCIFFSYKGSQEHTQIWRDQKYTHSTSSWEDHQGPVVSHVWDGDYCARYRCSNRNSDTHSPPWFSRTLFQVSSLRRCASWGEHFHNLCLVAFSEAHYKEKGMNR